MVISMKEINAAQVRTNAWGDKYVVIHKHGVRIVVVLEYETATRKDYI